MDALTAYQFLKPSLDNMPENEIMELCRLIKNEEKAPSLKKQKMSARNKRIAEMKKELLKTNLFKTKKATQ